MADIENRVDKLETRVTSLEVTVEKLSQKVDDFIEESRAAHKRHDDDIREMREDMRNLRTDLNNLGNYFRTTNITVIVGIAAMIIAVLLK
ncbi:MAG: hypothetical protein IJU91_00620 [Selenomonadaceae bacterium]|nr:hypothetical protein [Selenomonadaceae bacterium]